jgi:YVTN family beta-propeller protein
VIRSFVLSLCVFAAAAQTPEQPSRAVIDPGAVTTRQAITPAGAQSVFHGRVYGVVFGPSEAEIWVLNAGHVYRFDWKSNRVLDRWPVNGDPGLQSIQPWDRGAVVAADRKGRVRLFALASGTPEATVAETGGAVTGAIAVAGGMAVVPVISRNRLAVIDLKQRKLLAEAETGIAPFGAVLDREGKTAYVTNWGGRLPSPADLTAPTGLDPNADRVVIDPRGVAATGTVTRIDVASARATDTIAVGLHPTAILWDQPRGRIYVANSNSDSVSVIDPRQNRVVDTIPLQPFQVRTPGVAPTALAVSPDGARLFVACGGINAVAVVDTKGRKIEGLIPTAWYPNGLAVEPGGRMLAVSTLFGAGSGWRDEPRKRFVHSYRGSVAVLPVPDPAQLASYTTAVAENNRAPLAPVAPSRDAPPRAVPMRAGEPSPIEHVVFIIKENRTYDQVLGDLPGGNGDPSLVMFGRDVTPNQHKLAEEFVLLDNFYATGGNSADGHQWLTQANETAYCLWPGYAGRSYPFDGTDPIAYSETGFLWDAALKMNRTVRVYGEFAPRETSVSGLERPALLEKWKAGEDFTARWTTRSPIPPLDGLLARNFPAYTTAIPDVIRAQIFLKDVRQWVADGRMPNLVLVQLPSNHTDGASPSRSSPKAMVADNDLATGRVVEALSRTPFWNKMAIFIVEDDAQNGVDHVDGHRTVALVASPYARRGHVDSTFYSHQSMLKTIELMLGLPTLSLFDMIATDMRASFTDAPDYRPFTAEEPSQSLLDVNPPLKALRGEARRAAADSEKMRWDVPDAAPSERLNRILWHMVKGWKTRYPGTRRAVFSPLSVDLEDEERE